MRFEISRGILARMSKLFPNLKTFSSLALLSVIIFILDYYHLLSGIKTAGYLITNPISFGLYNINQNVRRQFYFIYGLRQSAQENRALKIQIGQLLSENANLKRQLSEAQSVLNQNQHLDPRTYELIPARPIGLDRYLRIDKGTDLGVKVGQPVVSGDNYIGKVSQVSPKTASIQLLADPDSKVAAFSQGLEGRAKGVLEGQFGLELLMDKILHEEKIAKGDLVYSEGTEGYLPRGLILGRVSEVTERENELFKQAKVKPTFDLRDLDLVFVIKE